jgi:hypothetical protein
MRRSYRPIAAASAAVLVIGAVGLASLPGQAAEGLSVEVTDLPDYEAGLGGPSYIILETGANNRVGILTESAYGEDGLGPGDYDKITWHQALSANSQCRLVSTPVDDLPPLVEITAVNPENPNDSRLYAGLVSGSIGVRSTAPGASEGKGEPCGRIDGLQQAIKVDLLGATATGFELDVEAKFDADLEVVLTPPNGQSVTGTFVTSTDNGSDNGPDSGDGDNFLVTSSALEPPAAAKAFPISSFTVQPARSSGGAVSLEGGSDYTTPTDDGPWGFALGKTVTIIEVGALGTGVLDCGDVDSSVDGVVLTRLATNADGSSCIAIPYSLSRDRDVITFAKDLLTGQEAAQFTLQVTWEPEVAPSPYSVTTGTQINYGQGAGEEDLEWCVGGVDGVIDPEALDLPAGVDADSDAPGQQGWCVVSQQNAIYGPDGGEQTIEVVETFYGVGDPRFNRL